MKNTFVSIYLLLLLTLTIHLPNAFAKDSPQWHLPEGAKARIGKGRIYDIAFSPDGTRLAVASSIGIWVYNAATGKELALFATHTSITCIVYSPDGKTIVGGGWNVRLWDAETGTHKTTFTGHNKWVDNVVYSPGGKTVASISGGTVRLWDAETGTHKTTFTGHNESVDNVVYSPDGKAIASIGNSSIVTLWDVKTGIHKVTLTGHNGWVSGIAYSPDGKTIAGGGYRGYLWDAETGTHKTTLEGPPKFSAFFDSVAYSPDGKTIASTGDASYVTLWDAETGTYKATLTAPSWLKSYSVSSGLYRVIYSLDGKTIATFNSDRSAVILWNAETGTHKVILTGHNGWDFWDRIAHSPDGKTIAGRSTENGDNVMLWDAETGTYKATFVGHTHEVDNVVYSPDGKTITSADSYTLRLWDAETGTGIHKITLPVYFFLRNVVYSPDGKTIIGGGQDSTVLLWDVQTGRHLRTLEGHTDRVNSVAFGPDGKTIASVDPYTVRLWDASTGVPLRTFTGHTDSGHTDSVNRVMFSPDGKTIAADDRGNVRLWDTETGQEIKTFIGHTEWVSDIAFSPDGKTIAAGDGRNVRLWDTETGQEIKTFIGHTGNIGNIAYSPDGKTLLTSSSDRTMLLWDLTPYTRLNATVSLLPSPIQLPAIGQQLTLNLKITDGSSVAGYQANVQFDTTALKYVRSANGDYLPSGAFFIPPVAEGNTVTLAASSLSGESNGDGTLATITFEVVAVRLSTIRLTNVLLTDSSGDSSIPQIENVEITEPPQLPEDVNRDGVVNIIDLTLVASNFGKTGQNAADVSGDGIVNIIDLTLVAAAFGNTAAAPKIWNRSLDGTLTRAEVEAWLREARQLSLTDPTFQRGILFLEQLLAALTPKQTALLPNYPNPFNPETWIPYQLAVPADVSISIYAADGKLVRTLALGHQPVGIYESRNRAAYWDGRNTLGEPVASGVYFYTLTAGEFTATRKMLIRK